jgi:hypothetical protein
MGFSMGIDADFYAMEDSHITYIKSSDILNILERQPKFSHIRRRYLALAKKVKANTEELVSDEQTSSRKAHAIFRWSLYVQLIMLTRVNDFSDITNSIGKSSRMHMSEANSTVSQLFDQRSCSIMLRQEQPSVGTSPTPISPDTSTKMLRYWSNEDIARPGTPLVTPKGPETSRLLASSHHTRNCRKQSSGISLSAEIVMLDSSPGTVHILQKSESSEPFGQKELTDLYNLFHVYPLQIFYTEIS